MNGLTMNAKQRSNAEWLAIVFVLVAWLGGYLFGTPFYVVTSPPAGTLPVYRYWNPQRGHVFTLDPNEIAKLRSEEWAAVWTEEGIAFHAWPDPNSLLGVTP